MIKGLYIAKAGMFGNAKKLNVTSNNLANISTTGFKKDKVFFNQLIDAQRALSNSGKHSDSANLETKTDFSTGRLQQTENPLDLAIVGEGFFEIQTPDKKVYTRNGNFTVDNKNRLVTQEGYPVMGTGGEIQVTGYEIKISGDGSILVDGQMVDKIRIVSFEDPSQLIKIGSTLFTEEGEAGIYLLEPETIQVRQGFIESSNVNGIDEIIQMIELYQQFELGQKTIRAHDETLEKLINDTGRVA
jgi:flagellar basal-body rod protein FlgF